MNRCNFLLSRCEMCSNCRAMRKLKERIEEAVAKVKEHHDEMSAKTAADHAQMGFDCCDSSEVILCEAVLDAAKYLGCQSR